MVRLINGRTITDEDIEQIKDIFYSRCGPEYKRIENRTPYMLKSRKRCYNVLLGDDWYLVYTTKFRKIILDEMVAKDNITTARTVEMLKSLRELVMKSKECVFVSCLRHDTTYRLLVYLFDHKYIKILKHRVYSMHPDLELGDEMVEQVKSNRKIDEDLYKYVMHSVSFKLTDKMKGKRRK